MSLYAYFAENTVALVYFNCEWVLPEGVENERAR